MDGVTEPSTAERAAIPAAITASGVVAIARGVDAAKVSAIGLALLRGGVSAFELTLNEPETEALDAIREVATRFAGSDLLLGAGTVLSVASAERAVEAGARFIVSPHTDRDLVAWAVAAGIPVFPGAFTATEILAGWQAGAVAVGVGGWLIGNGEPQGVRERAAAIVAAVVEARSMGGAPRP